MDTHNETLADEMRSLLAAYESAVRSLGRHLQLGPNDLAALQHLMEHPDQGPADLAVHLGITSASATVLVDRLEGSGLVERHEHPSDRRRRVIRLTPLAPATVLGAMQPLMKAEAALHEQFTVVERTAIVEFLHRTHELYVDFAGSPNAAPPAAG